MITAATIVLAVTPPAGTDHPTIPAAETTSLCAVVTSPVAHVFPTPGADPYPKIAKYSGDQITLYRDTADASGPDGRRYRAIRSPARADPGKSPYSWMRADDISDTPCDPPRRPSR